MGDRACFMGPVDHACSAERLTCNPPNHLVRSIAGSTRPAPSPTCASTP
jgi:hypothetical protein